MWALPFGMFRFNERTKPIWNAAIQDFLELLLLIASMISIFILVSTSKTVSVQ